MHTVCVCVYVNVCVTNMYVHWEVLVYLGRYQCPCMYVWKSEVDVRNVLLLFSKLLFIFFFLRQGLSLNLELAVSARLAGH